jgi:hypothetical protein
LSETAAGKSNSTDRRRTRQGTIPEPDKVKCPCRIKDILVAVKEEHAEPEKVLLKISST